MIYLESFGTLKEIIFGTGHATFCLTNGTFFIFFSNSDERFEDPIEWIS